MLSLNIKLEFESPVTIPVNIPLPLEYKKYMGSKFLSFSLTPDLASELSDESLLSTSQELVYIIQVKNKNIYKIGFSKHPESRVNELQTGHHRELNLVYWSPGDMEFETHLHEMMEDKRTRIKGEWFKLDKKDLNIVMMEMWKRKVDWNYANREICESADRSSFISNSKKVDDIFEIDDSDENSVEEESEDIRDKISESKNIEQNVVDELPKKKRTLRTQKEPIIQEEVQSFETKLKEALLSKSKIKVNSLIKSHGGGDYDLYMGVAATVGSLKWVKEFIEQGANDWEHGMRCAIIGGHLNLVKFFIGKGAAMIEDGIKIAIKHGKLGIVKFFFPKKKMWNFQKLISISIRSKSDVKFDIIDYFIERIRNIVEINNRRKSDDIISISSYISISSLIETAIELDDPESAIFLCRIYRMTKSQYRDVMWFDIMLFLFTRNHNSLADKFLKDTSFIKDKEYIFSNYMFEYTDKYSKKLTEMIMFMIQYEFDLNLLFEITIRDSNRSGGDVIWLLDNLNISLDENSVETYILSNNKFQHDDNTKIFEYISSSEIDINKWISYVIMAISKDTFHCVPLIIKKYTIDIHEVLMKILDNNEQYVQLKYRDYNLIIDNIFKFIRMVDCDIEKFMDLLMLNMQKYQNNRIAGDLIRNLFSEDGLLGPDKILKYMIITVDMMNEEYFRLLYLISKPKITKEMLFDRFEDSSKREWIDSLMVSRGDKMFDFIIDRKMMRDIAFKSS